MKHILIAPPIILLTMIIVLQVHSQWDSSSEYSKESARRFVESRAKEHFTGYVQREEFRESVKVLSITLSSPFWEFHLARLRRKNTGFGCSSLPSC